MNHGGHHWDCSGSWFGCTCEGLWRAEESFGDLEHAYGQFYDPDFDSDPLAEIESYGGWVRAHRGATH